MVLLLAARTDCNSSHLLRQLDNSFSMPVFSSFLVALTASRLLSLEAELSCLVMLLSGVVALELDLEVSLEETAVSVGCGRLCRVLKRGGELMSGAK